MAENILSLTLDALNLSLSSHISKSEREKCDNFIHELKMQENCVHIIAELVSSTDETVCTPYIKLLALSILNDWIKIWWNKLPDERKFAVKQIVCELLSGPLAVHEHSAIRTKVAVILANVVERVFPQYWPNFIAEMVSVWQSSPFARQDVVLKILEIVIVDSVDIDFNASLPTLRRQEIVAGIVENQNLLLNTSYQYLIFCIQEFRTYEGNLSSSTGKIVLDALNSLLSMIGALSSLLKIEEFCAHPHNFAIVIMELSNAQKVQIKAMEVLLTIFQQHMTVELFSEVFQAVAANSITSVPSELEDSLHFQRLYAGAIHSLLSQHVSFVTDTSSAFYRLIADPVRQFQAFVRTMIVTVVSSPSIRLPGDVIKEWVKIYRDKNCRNCEVLRDSAMEVLNVFLRKCRKPLWNEFPVATPLTKTKAYILNATEPRPTVVGGGGTAGATMAVNTTSTANTSATNYTYSVEFRRGITTEMESEVFEIEFEDTEEWSSDYYGTFKSQFRLLAQIVSEQFTSIAAQTITGYMESLVHREVQLVRTPLAVFAQPSDISKYPPNVQSEIISIRTLLLEFDMLHYIYGPLLQLLSPDWQKGAADVAKDIEIPASELAILQNVALNALNFVFQWTPKDVLFRIEQYKVLQYQFPVLKRSTEHLKHTFQMLFSGINSGMSTNFSDLSSNSVTVDTEAVLNRDLNTRLGSIVASLTQHCAGEIVNTGFFQDFFNQVGLVLTTVPMNVVQNSMRQALMALSDHIIDGNTKFKALTLAVEDLVIKMSDVGFSIFSSREALVEALIDQIQHEKSQDRVVDSQIVNRCTRFETVKRVLDSFILATKRIGNPPIPVETWSQYTPVRSDPSVQELNDYRETYIKIFPFAPAWLQVLPIGFRAVTSLHSMFSMETRQQSESLLLSNSCQNSFQRDFCASIVFPEAAEVAKAAGMKVTNLGTVTSSCVARFAYELREMRIFLYQFLAQSATHKAIYFAQDSQLFLDELLDHLPVMENTQIVLLVRNFVEPYVLNALPPFYGQISRFLERFMSHTLQRISVAYDSSGEQLLNNSNSLLISLYRQCGIPNAYNGLNQLSAHEIDSFTGFSGEEIDTARENIIASVTKAYSDMLASFIGLRGFLYSPQTAAAIAAEETFHLRQNSPMKPSKPLSSSASSVGRSGILKGGMKSSSAIGNGSEGRGSAAAAPVVVRKRVSFDNTYEDQCDGPLSQERRADGTVAISEDQQLEIHKHARRLALGMLLFHPVFANVTKPFVSSIVAMICLPEANASRTSIQIAQKMLDLCITDSRFIVVVAKEAFVAAISVLLKQEKWSIGMEWELIEFILDVYLMLVIGEGRFPVNSNPNGPPDAMNTPVSNNNNPNMTMSLAPIQVHQARSDWPKQILLSLAGMSPAKLETFEVSLQKILSKKKRRGLMRDLIGEVVQAQSQQQQGVNNHHISGSGGGAAAGSVFQCSIPEVLDVRHRLMRANKGQNGGSTMPRDSSDIDLSNLFA